MEREKFLVSDEAFTEIEKVLNENPIKANEKLKELMARKPAWEKPSTEKAD